MASHRAHLFGHTLREELDLADPGIGPTAHEEDTTMSSSATTPENLHTPNQSIAANLAITSPTTPSRPTPNSAKKRRPVPDLSRPTATPGHGVKMSMIFRNAANSLQSSCLPTHQPSSNTKKCRVPLSQARSVKFGNTSQKDTMVSSGLGTPQKISQHLRGSGEPEWASSETTRKPASGGHHNSTPTPLTKAGRATIGTFTNQCRGAAAGIGASCFNETPRVSGASFPLRLEDEGKDTISGGFTTPIAPTPNSSENPDEVKYPILENWPSLKSCCDSSSLDSDNGDLHSTHGVPFILPFPHADSESATRSDINTWLNGIADATNFGPSSSPKQSYGIEDLLMSDVPFSRMTASNLSTPTRTRASRSKLKPDSQSSSRASSNKENISPSKTSSSPTRATAQAVQAKTPSRFCQINNLPTLQHAKAVHSAHPLSPQRHLSLPPKRKRPRVDGIASSRVEAEMPISRKDFTIREDQLAEALVQLSPDVERHRKGRGPKKGRCMSYWDEDILPPGLQCVPMDMDGKDETMGKEKQVLRESHRAVELTADLPFAKDAGSANFRFKA